MDHKEGKYRAKLFTKYGFSEDSKHTREVWCEHGCLVNLNLYFACCASSFLSTVNDR